MVDKAVPHQHSAKTPTLGVEEEFLLCDPHTGRPSLRNTEVAAAADELGLTVQLELSRCQIETSTSIGTHIRDLRDQLCESRAVTADAAARTGCQLLAVGTPFYDPPPDSITATPRYQQMAEQFGALTTGVMCGCHVHVGVEDREQAVQVINHLRPWLPTLLALTANSPISAGVDTGYASWRHIRFGRWPSYRWPASAMGSITESTPLPFLQGSSRLRHPDPPTSSAGRLDLPAAAVRAARGTAA